MVGPIHGGLVEAPNPQARDHPQPPHITPAKHTLILHCYTPSTTTNTSPAPCDSSFASSSTFTSTCGSSYQAASINARRPNRYRLHESSCSAGMGGGCWRIQPQGGKQHLPPKVKHIAGTHGLDIVLRVQLCLHGTIPELPPETCRKAFLCDRMLSTSSTVASGVRKHRAYCATAALHASLCTDGPMTFVAT